MFRRQPPTFSPMSLGALAAGTGAAVRNGARAAATADQALCDHFRVRAARRTSSGTAALQIALGTVADRGPIAMPAFGCYDLASAAVGAGARVLLYDIDPETLGPDTESLHSVLARGAGAVVVAHLYGLAVDMRQVHQLVAGVPVIEDAAQGMGATLNGRPLGGHGSLGVLSFGRGKGVTTGRGGAVLASDDVGERLLAAAGTGTPAAGWGDLARALAMATLGRPRLFWIPAALPGLRVGETTYRAPARPGEQSRAGAAMLAATWDRAIAEAAIRRRHAARLLARVMEHDGVTTPQPCLDSVPGYLRLPVRVPDVRRRTRLLTAGRDLGVAASYPMPLSRLEAVQGVCDNLEVPQPGAASLARELVTLPVHSLLRERDFMRIEELFDAV